jgi:hypothetical protein
MASDGFLPHAPAYREDKQRKKSISTTQNGTIVTE